MTDNNTIMTIPDDMVFYYNTTDGKTHYFSVYYSTRKNTIRIVAILEDDLWAIVQDGNLKLKEIEPLNFPHPLPGNIAGNVKAFII